MRCALLLALLCAGQSFGAAITGVVKDPSGAAVTQATVTLESPQHTASTATDSEGRFAFPDIPAGPYHFVVTHDGFEPFSGNVTAAASSAPLAINLQVTALKTVVQVTGARSALRNADPNYQALRGNSLRGVYAVKDLVLQRDAATFTFRSGTFSFHPPVLGHVTAGVFLGDGNFQLKPAFEIAANHLKQISKAAAVDEDFGSLVLYFSDSTFDQIKAHAEALDQSPKAHQDDLQHVQNLLRARDPVPETYLQRMINADDVPNMEAELLAELYNGTGGSFRAFIHGRKHPGLRFLLNPLGALPQLPAPEEVALLNFEPDSDDDGIWYLAHTIPELQAGHANSAEEKRLVSPEHYRIETAINNGLRLSVVCELRFRPLREGVRAIKFDLLPDMQVSRMTLDGREIPFVQENRNRDGAFYVIAPQPLSKDHACQLTFEYEGGEMIRDTGAKLFTILPVLPWYPRVGGVSRATYEMTFRVPRGVNVIATGDRSRGTTEGGQDVSQWVSRIPIPLAGFNYGYFYDRQRTDPTNGFQLEGWLGSVPKGLLTPSSTLGLLRAENAVRVFEHWFGAPPFQHLAVTEARYQGSLPALVFARAASMTDDATRYAAVAGLIRDRPVPMPQIAGARFDESLPREVSRQWWGALVSPVSFHEEWLMRGLIDFSGSVYDMSAETGTNDFLEHWRRSRDSLLTKTFGGVRITDAAPLWLGAMAESFLVQRGPDLPPRQPCIAIKPFLAPCTALTGMKGGYVFHMLRGLMFDSTTGDQDFIAMMHDFTASFQNQNVSTEAFKAIVERHMKPALDLEGNHRMDWFFREWVYGTELPSYSLEYSIGKGDDGKPLLRGKLTQSGVSDRFRMRVPIYARFAAKPVRIGALTLSGNQTREFQTALPQEPKKVQLNANCDILCAAADVRQVR